MAPPLPPAPQPLEYGSRRHSSYFEEEQEELRLEKPEHGEYENDTIYFIKIYLNYKNDFLGFISRFSIPQILCI